MRTPRLSVVLAVLESWLDVREAVERLLEQAAPVGAEIIVLDNTSDGSTCAAVRDRPGVVVRHFPGKSVFQLRAIGWSLARGDILAFTEDHARVGARWCEQMLHAHERYPDASAVGGAVENAATESLREWANFLIPNAPYMEPIPAGPAKAIALQANCSYKRNRITTEFDEDGLLHHEFHSKLCRQGAVMVSEPCIVVEHDQRGGFLELASGHFHNGRSIAGFRLKTIPAWERCLRAATFFLLPPLMTYRTLGILLRKGRLSGPPMRSMILVPFFLCWHAAGELVGYIAGLGNAPLGVK